MRRWASLQPDNFATGNKLKEKTIRYTLGVGALLAPIFVVLMLAHICQQAWPAISEIGFGLLDPAGRWQPLSVNPAYSLLPALAGTLYVSLLAVLLSVPLGLGCALFLHFYTGKRLAAAMMLLVDLLAGVPSVIFGFLGLMVIVRGFETGFSMTAGECVLAAAVLLAIMLLPYVVSTCGESIADARARWLPAAASLGSSKEYCIRKVILPGIRPGVLSSALTAFGRALGETMAVMMVIGNSAVYPKLFGRAQTIAGLTALEVGSAEYGSLHLSAIYAANLILLLLLGVVWLMARLIKKRMEG
ncbi:MAG: phosphate ABC transporter permease subunit PstC [Lachnospiraceae bacterium]